METPGAKAPESRRRLDRPSALMGPRIRAGRPESLNESVPMPTSDSTSDRLRQLGLVLPPAAAPVANFVAVTLHGSTAYVSGQIPVLEGNFLNPGLLGREVSVERGQAAARLAALNVLSQLSSALGGKLDRVERVLRLGVFVAATPDFKDHPKVANGASDLVVEVFRERGAHARAAVGVASLPFGVSVEVDGIFAISV